MGPDRGLNDYLAILRSPEIYPDIAGAGFFMTPLISVASNIIAYCGMIAMVFVLLRIGADVLIMSGLTAIIGNSKNDIAGKVSKFASPGVEKCNGDVMTYIKTVAWRTIVMLAFIGLMISGQLLPLAGTVTASTGAVLAKIGNINPVPYIEAVSIDFSSLNKTISRVSVSSLMKDYNNHVANMTTIKNESMKDGLTDAEYTDLARAYANSYVAAEKYSVEMETVLHNALMQVGDATSPRKMTTDEERLRSFNFMSHQSNTDQRLLAQGKNDKTIGSTITTELSSITTKREQIRAAKNSNTQIN